MRLHLSQGLSWGFLLVASFTGTVAAAAPLDVVLNLKPRVSMASLAQSVLDPASPRFRRYYSPQEIRDLAAPAPAELDALARTLQAHGLQVVAASPSRLMVIIRGDSQQIEQAFNTRIQELPNSHGIFRPIAPPSVPTELALVDSVSGLDNSHLRCPRWAIPLGQVPTAEPQGILPQKIRQLYGFDNVYKAGITGQGQDIAIATYGGFHMEDVMAYYAKFGITPTPRVDIVNFNGVAKLDPDAAEETQTDVEFAGMIAPGAALHVFASARNDDAGEVQMFTAILDDPRIKIVNYSWGSCDADLGPAHKKSMDALFARAIAQGVNILAASGDNGSAGCDDNPNTVAKKGATVADFPASHPGVLAIGGTSIVRAGNGLDERAWSHSGGGISQVYPAPTWQSMLRLQGRGEPDISFNADPNSGEPTLIHDAKSGKAGFIVIGGTSIAAPQLSGFLALVGQARGGRPLGPLAPILYSIPPQQRDTLLHDIVQGSNGAYSAGPGWDPVTGWGSPRVDALLKYLVGA